MTLNDYLISQGLDNTTFPYTGISGEPTGQDWKEMFNLTPGLLDDGKNIQSTQASTIEPSSNNTNKQIEQKLVNGGSAADTAQNMAQEQQAQASQIASQGSTIEANKEKQMQEASQQASQAHQQQLKEQQESLGLVKFALNFIPGWGQLINAVDDASTGNIMGAITNGLGAANGFGSTNTVNPTTSTISGDNLFSTDALGRVKGNFFPMNKNYF